MGSGEYLREQIAEATIPFQGCYLSFLSMWMSPRDLSEKSLASCVLLAVARPRDQTRGPRFSTLLFQKHDVALA